MAKLLANSGDPDQTHSAASDLGLYCLQITLVGVPRLQWANVCFIIVSFNPGSF